MMRLIIIIVFVVLNLFSSISMADGGYCSNAATAGNGGCIAYQHGDFGGKRQDLGRNRTYNYVGDNMNDEISSFRVSPGCYVIAWEDANKGGASTTFGECGYIGDEWNDSISSWTCKCSR